MDQTTVVTELRKLANAIESGETVIHRLEIGASDPMSIDSSGLTIYEKYLTIYTLGSH